MASLFHKPLQLNPYNLHGHMKCIFVYCICKKYLHLMSTHSACTMDSSMTQMLYQSMFPDNINLIIVKLDVESIFILSLSLEVFSCRTTSHKGLIEVNYQVDSLQSVLSGIWSSMRIILERQINVFTSYLVNSFKLMTERNS